MTSATMTVRLDDQLKTRLDRLAEVTHRSKSFLAADAISKYLEIQEWQAEEIKTAIIEADSGKLIDHDTIVKRWEKNHTHSMDKRR